MSTAPRKTPEGSIRGWVTVEGVTEKLMEQNPFHSIGLRAVLRAITKALDRSHTPLCFLRGPIAERRRLRSGLGYIAVAGDQDPPHRLANVYFPDFSPAPGPVGGIPRLPDLEVYHQNAIVGVPVERSDWSHPASQRDY